MEKILIRKVGTHERKFRDKSESCEGSSERARVATEFQSRKGISEIEGKAAR
jgi:hypothetical protein